MMDINRFSVKGMLLTSALALALGTAVAAQEPQPQSVPTPPEEPIPTPKPAPPVKPSPPEEPAQEDEEEEVTPAEKGKQEEVGKPEKAGEKKTRPSKEAEPVKKPPAAEKADEAKEPKAEAVDEEAVKAVVEMSERLAALQSFTIKADTAWEEVLENGEKIMSLESIEADVLPPHGLRMARRSPGQERIFYYDGSKAVLWGPITRYYTEVPFDGSLAELAIHLADEYAYELPLADLFLWGRDKSNIEAIQAANLVGEDIIGERVCNHYAFRQENVDWQIWIDKEGGLPCRYAIIDLSDPARPVFQATVEIEPDAEFFDKRFTFAAPKDAAKIPLAKSGDAEDEE